MADRSLTSVQPHYFIVVNANPLGDEVLLLTVASSQIDTVGVPPQYSWATLRPLKGAELEVRYVKTLRALGTEKGILGQIFTKAQNKITDPAKLARLIEMVDATEWVMLDSEVKGDIYEGILEKNAEDTKSGAGQYFTPRALIAAMVECVAPEPPAKQSPTPPAEPEASSSPPTTTW